MTAVDETPTAPTPDLNMLEVDATKEDRFHKAAFVHSKAGTTHRLVAKILPDGKLDLVRFACDLDTDGTMNKKRGTRRIDSQPVERFDEELASIQKDITGKGEEGQGVWAHDLTTIQEVAEQAGSVKAWAASSCQRNTTFLRRDC